MERQQKLLDSLTSVRLTDPSASSSSSPDTGPEPAYTNVVSGYNVHRSQSPFGLVLGGVLPEVEIAYESWGQLNAKRDNVILLCTGLSGSSHARSHAGNTAEGWWEKFIGPGYPLDTNRFHIICTNVIGGCYGSTGPSSVIPTSSPDQPKERYATRFPVVSIWDMVRAQFRMLEEMGIHTLHAVVGSSMGGMQSLAASLLYPNRIGRLVSISAAARSHPYSIAMRYAQRQVLMSDPNWARGEYYNGVPPHVGMKLARQIATITYRSGPEWEERFGRKKADPDAPPAMCADYLIERYLDHQASGEKWCLQYDANSFLYISKAMDMFDLSESPYEHVALLDSIEDAERQVNINDIVGNREKEVEILRKLNKATEAIGKLDAKNARLDQQVDSSATCPAPSTPSSLQEREQKLKAQERQKSDIASERKGLVSAMKRIKMPALVLGVQSDILFPCWQQREIAECLRESGNKDVTYYELDAIYGHDTFLIDRTNVGGAVKGHLENVILH
ncbi:hypothetical protein HDU97_006706 [Phlyctochytrium planicorne]|nr:hypothetical protein HDU97_006706 [Phlyctochytrium planicorne]